MQRRLERSATNRVMTGVCGGVAEYLAVDATLVRAFFVIATVVTAFLFLLVYIVLIILMPLPGQRAPIDDLWPGARTSGAAPGAEATDIAAGGAPRNGHDADRRRDTVGYVLVALGAVFFLANLGAFRFFRWDLVWPVVLIGLGALLLLQRTRS